MWALAYKVVPTYVWTEDIIRDHLDWDIKDISDIAGLSPIACLIFRGQCTAKGGFTAEDVREIIDKINGGCTRTGKDLVITTWPWPSPSPNISWPRYMTSYIPKGYIGWVDQAEYHSRGKYSHRCWWIPSAGPWQRGTLSTPNRWAMREWSACCTHQQLLHHRHVKGKPRTIRISQW